MGKEVYHSPRINLESSFWNFLYVIYFPFFTLSSWLTRSHAAFSYEITLFPLFKVRILRRIREVRPFRGYCNLTAFVVVDRYCVSCSTVMRPGDESLGGSASVKCCSYRYIGRAELNEIE